MSTQHSSEILTFGYVRQIYSDMIPDELLQVVGLFHGEHFYWTITDDTLMQFVSAQKGEKIVCPKRYTIKGIHFEVLTYPNGWDGASGLVIAGLKIKYFPESIEYIQFILDLTFKATHCLNKRYLIHAKSVKSGFPLSFCQLSEIKNEKIIGFDAMIIVKYVKYKSGFNKTDICFPINIMQKKKNRNN
eukprot:523832_1